MLENALLHVAVHLCCVLARSLRPKLTTKRSSGNTAISWVVGEVPLQFHFEYKYHALILCPLQCLLNGHDEWLDQPLN